MTNTDPSADSNEETNLKQHIEEFVQGCKEKGIEPFELGVELLNSSALLLILRAGTEGTLQILRHAVESVKVNGPTIENMERNALPPQLSERVH